MTKTPLLLVPGLLCSPRLFAPQLAALADIAEIVVPDWRKAPLSIFDSWDKTARWVIDQMPAEKFALAGLSLGGMIAVEIMQIAADRVTKLALLDTGMRSQSPTEQRDPPRPHPARQRGPVRAGAGPADVALHPGLSAARQGAGRRGDGDVHRDRRRNLQAPGGAGRRPRRPPPRPAEDQVPDHRRLRPRRCGDAAVHVGGDHRRHQGQRD